MSVSWHDVDDNVPGLLAHDGRITINHDSAFAVVQANLFSGRVICTQAIQHNGAGGLIGLQ